MNAIFYTPYNKLFKSLAHATDWRILNHYLLQLDSSLQRRLPNAGE